MEFVYKGDVDQLFLRLREICGLEVESRVRSFIEYVSLEKSHCTAISYLYDIWIGLRFLKFKTWGEVLAITVQDFRNLCAFRHTEEISIASQQRMVVAWKSLLKWAYVDTLQNFRIPKVPKRYPRPILEEIIDSIIEINGSWKVLRNKSLWLLMYGSGMRISEALSLKVSDVDEKAVLIRGKGGIMRLALILPIVREALIEYLEKRLIDSDILFVDSSGKKLSQQNAAQIFRRWSDRMGIDRRITLHSMRHGFATHMLKGGCPVPGLQKLLGHSQVASTANYVQVQDEQLQEKLNKIDI